MIGNNWAKDAACVGSEVDFFSSDPLEKKMAKSICNSCPVKKICLQTALDNKERFGIFGGADELELRRDQSIDAFGEPHVSSQGKIRCPHCLALSTRYLEVVTRYRTRTDIRCSRCGLEWTVRKVINRKNSNF